MKNIFTAALITTAALCTIDAATTLGAKAASYCEDIQPGVTFCAQTKDGQTANLTLFEGNSKTIDLDVKCTNLGNGRFEFEYDGRSTYGQKATHELAGEFCEGFLF